MKQIKIDPKSNQMQGVGSVGKRLFSVGLETKNPDLRPPLSTFELQGDPRLFISEIEIGEGNSVTTRNISGPNADFIEFVETSSNGYLRITGFRNSN